jgi:hypothetical protein
MHLALLTTALCRSFSVEATKDLLDILPSEGIPDMEFDNVEVWLYGNFTQTNTFVAVDRE